MSFGGGGGGGYTPPPDTSAIVAQQQQAANDAANQEKVRRANAGGAFSLLYGGTGYQGVTGQQSKQTLGNP